MLQIDLEPARALFRNQPGLAAAWSFGSGREGRIADGSDLDLAAWFETPPTSQQALELREQLERVLGFDRIDLVLASPESDPVLLFEVVCGKPLFIRNADEFAEFVSLAARQYEDEIAFAARALRERNLT